MRATFNVIFKVVVTKFLLLGCSATRELFENCSLSRDRVLKAYIIVQRLVMSVIFRGIDMLLPCYADNQKLNTHTYRVVDLPHIGHF